MINIQTVPAQVPKLSSSWKWRKYEDSREGLSGRKPGFTEERRGCVSLVLV